MMLPPTHVGRSPEAIIKEHPYLDSVGYLYRAMSWLNYFERIDHFPALLYACIEGRYGIEYLLFEEIIIGTGAQLSREDYESCLREPTKLAKIINRLVPDYEKLQQFTSAIVADEPRLPKLVHWEPRSLMKSWGVLSEYLHWFGAKNETTEISEWRSKSHSNVKKTLDPIWNKITTGQRGLMCPNDMAPEIQEIWNDFKNEKVDLEGAKIRMNILKPMLIAKFAQTHR